MSETDKYLQSLWEEFEPIRYGGQDYINALPSDFWFSPDELEITNEGVRVLGCQTMTDPSPGPMIPIQRKENKPLIQFVANELLQTFTETVLDHGLNNFDMASVDQGPVDNAPTSEYIGAVIEVADRLRDDKGLVTINNPPVWVLDKCKPLLAHYSPEFENRYPHIEENVDCGLEIKDTTRDFTEALMPNYYELINDQKSVVRVEDTKDGFVHVMLKKKTTIASRYFSRSQDHFYERFRGHFRVTMRPKYIPIVDGFTAGYGDYYAVTRPRKDFLYSHCQHQADILYPKSFKPGLGLYRVSSRLLVAHHVGHLAHGNYFALDIVIPDGEVELDELFLHFGDTIIPYGNRYFYSYKEYGDNCKCHLEYSKYTPATLPRLTIDVPEFVLPWEEYVIEREEAKYENGAGPELPVDDNNIL